METASKSVWQASGWRGDRGIANVFLLKGKTFRNPQLVLLILSSNSLIHYSHQWLNWCCAHVGDNLIGLWVGRGRRWWRRCGQDSRVSPVQILDALLVVLAQPQRVREGVVGRHDGPRLAGVLQAQDVPKLMGSNLEEVCACGGRREQ